MPRPRVITLLSLADLPFFSVRITWEQMSRQFQAVANLDPGLRIALQGGEGTFLSVLDDPLLSPFLEFFQLGLQTYTRRTTSNHDVSAGATETVTRT